MLNTLRLQAEGTSLTTPTASASPAESSASSSSMTTRSGGRKKAKEVKEVKEEPKKLIYFYKLHSPPLSLSLLYHHFVTLQSSHRPAQPYEIFHSDVYPTVMQANPKVPCVCLCV